MDSKTLISSGFLDDCQSDLRVITPSVSCACLQGEGTLIDYVVCSGALAQLIGLQPAWDALWRPHLALDVHLPLRPRAHTVLRLSHPKKFADGDNSQTGSLPTWGTHHHDYRVSQHLKETAFTSTVQDIPVVKHMVPAAAKLAPAAKAFAANLEAYIGQLKGIPPQAFRGYQGRLSYPKLIEVPVVPAFKPTQPPQNSRQHTNGQNSECG